MARQAGAVRFCRGGKLAVVNGTEGAYTRQEYERPSRSESYMLGLTNHTGDRRMMCVSWLHYTTPRVYLSRKSSPGPKRTLLNKFMHPHENCIAMENGPVLVCFSGKLAVHSTRHRPAGRCRPPRQSSILQQAQEEIPWRVATYARVQCLPCWKHPLTVYKMAM